MSQAGLVDIEGSHPQIPTSFVTDDGIAIPIANVLEILGTTVANYGVPLRTTGSGNTVTVVAQYATANATSDATLAGLSSYDSAFFSVDSNGFVSFIGSTSVTINGDTGSITGNNLTIFANNATNNAGASVKFVNAVTTSVLNVTDVNLNTFIGKLSGTLTVSGSENTGLGSTALAAISSGLFNTAVGSRALASMQSGLSNTAVGLAALNSNVSGQENVAVGEECLTLNTASFNTAVGCKSMNAAGAGQQNSYLGFAAGNAVTSGNSNTGVGYRAQPILTTGTFNDSIGSQCFNTLLTGSFNLGLGSGSGQNYTGAESSNILLANPGVLGESNTIRIGAQGSGSQQQNRAFMAGIVGVTVTGNFVNISSTGQLGSVSSGSIGQTITGNTGGPIAPVAGNWNIVNAGTNVPIAGTVGTLTQNFALDFLTIGSNPVGAVSVQQTLAVGCRALEAVTSSSGLTAIGNQALLKNTTGTFNTAVGNAALANIINNSQCTAVGWSALLNCAQSGNTAVGWSALAALTSGSQSAALGWNALASSNGSGQVAVGFATLQSATSGSLNTAVGGSAGLNLVGGSANIFLGQNAGNSYSSSESNNIAIGNLGIVGESNKIRIGQQGTGSQQQDESYIAGQLNGLSGRSYTITTPGAYPYTVLKSDYVIPVDTSTARTINLPAVPVNTPVYIIKDNTGTAATNNITVSGNGNNIDGVASKIINTNYGFLRFVWNGGQWNII